MRLPSSRALTTLLVAALAACSSSTEPTRGSPGITAIAGAAVHDTIDAAPTQALIVEVRDAAGQLASGTVVRFAVVPATGGSPYYYGYPLYLSSLASPNRTTFVADTTDDHGAAQVLVQLGEIAGTQRLVVSAPSFGYVDTVSYSVLAGAAARVVVPVRDTTQLVGAAYPLAASVTDRVGNPRSGDAVSWTSANPAVATTTTTGTVSAIGVGATWFRARFGTLVDSTRLFVAPPLVIAGLDRSSSPGQLVSMRLDGSQRTTYATTNSYTIMSRWDGTGTHLTYYEGDPGNNAQIRIVDLQGRVSTPTYGTTTVRTQFLPVLSADGRTVYFSAYDASYQIGLWRSALDGSGLENVAPATPATQYGVDVSPDNSAIIWSYAGQLQRRDLATGITTALGLIGDYPRFSHDGRQLVYIGGGGMWIANADGTGARRLGTRSYDNFASAPTFSSDGQWIVARGVNGMELIRVTTGEVFDVRGLSNLAQPAVKP